LDEIQAIVAYMPRKISILLSSLVASLPLIFWIVASYPASMNSDSFIVWQEAKNNTFSNWHPITYVLYIDFWQLFGDLPVLPMIGQVVLFAISTIYFIGSFPAISYQMKCFIIFCFTCIPSVGIFTTTLSKDSIFVSTFMVATGALVRLNRHDTKRTFNIFLVAIVLVTILRWNGIIISLVLVLQYVYLEYRRNSFGSLSRIATVSAAYFVGVALLFNPLLGQNNGGRSLQFSGKMIDVAYVLLMKPSAFSTNELNIIENVAPISSWANSQLKCDNAVMPLIWGVFTMYPGAADKIVTHQDELENIWKRLLVSDTQVVVSGRVCRSLRLASTELPTSSVVFYPSSGLLLEYLGLNFPPLLQNQIYIQDRISSYWNMSFVGRFFGQPINYTVPLILVLIWLRYKKISIDNLVIVAIAAGSVVLSLFIGATGVEQRYIFPATFVLFLYLLTQLTSIFWPRRLLRQNT
jgi:hypothetical protein